MVQKHDFGSVFMYIIQKDGYVVQHLSCHTQTHLYLLCVCVCLRETKALAYWTSVRELCCLGDSPEAYCGGAVRVRPRGALQQRIMGMWGHCTFACCAPSISTPCCVAWQTPHVTDSFVLFSVCCCFFLFFRWDGGREEDSVGS